MKQRDTNGIVWMQIFPQDKPFDNKLWKLCNMPPYILPSNYFPLMAKQNGVEWEKREAKNNQPGFFVSPNNLLCLILQSQ